ncbi:MAG: hypothetical protein HY855_02705 [Burkholderiales bacterium]|nr:hypothetical protein [Burkholderiales bacterium]
MAREPLFKSEADLCAAFISWVDAEAGRFSYGIQCPKWTPYAETAGWDILLVGPDGTQIGIQAKLRFNLKVLAQTLPERWAHWHDQGPDYRAVLVPERDGGAEQICAALGLMLFAPTRVRFDSLDRVIREFRPGLNLEHADGWHYWSPRKRCEVPEFVPDVPAGASGPVQLTKWKIAALRIVATLEVRGFVTKADFRRHQVNPRRWTGPSGWLVAGAEPGQFLRGPDLDFDAQHPKVYAEVLGDIREQLAAELVTP